MQINNGKRHRPSFNHGMVCTRLRHSFLVWEQGGRSLFENWAGEFRDLYAHPNEKIFRLWKLYNNHCILVVLNFK